MKNKKKAYKTFSLNQIKGIEEVILDSKAELKKFRNEIKDKDITEINLVYRAGKYIMTIINMALSRIQMIDAGLIKGTKTERKQYNQIVSDPKTKYYSMGYSWDYIRPEITILSTNN